MTGVELIAEERSRQILEEGWSFLHDARHRGGELSKAAQGYLNAMEAVQVVTLSHEPDRYVMRPRRSPPGSWPWSKEWWKPSDDPIRNLVKAGALIAAEIDRLQRVGN